MSSFHPLDLEKVEQDQIIIDLGNLSTTVTNNTNSINAISFTSVNNQLAGSASSGLKTLIVANDTDIENIKDKTDYITISQAVNLDTMESNINTNNSKVSMTFGTNSSTALRGDTVVITSSQSSKITANENSIDDIENKTDHISVTQAVNLDTMESNINTNNSKVSMTFGTSSSTALRGDTSLLQLGTSSSTALAGNTSLLQLGTSSSTALRGDVSLLQIGTSSSTALAGNTSLLQIGTSSSTALAGNTSLLQIGTSSSTALAGNTSVVLTNGNNQIVSLTGSSSVSLANNQFLANSIVSGQTNKWIRITSKQNALPGNSGYYPILEGGHTNLYFVVGGNYVAYLRNSPVVGFLDFTGQHRCVPEDLTILNNLQNNVGKIVISTGKINSLIIDDLNIHKQTTGKKAITIDESCPVVSLCNNYMDKRAFGIISSGEDVDNPLPNGQKSYNQGAFTSVIHADIEDNRLFINSVGEGAVLVYDKQNIQNGDYITTSSLSGYGCKQMDDILHNYTVAKSTIDCDFNLESNFYECYEIEIDNITHKVALISCTYHCG